MNNNVVSMKPFVVAVPVCLELPLITMEVTLSFGPFNSYEEGKQWVARFELARTQLESAGDLTIEGVFAGVQLSTRPFIDVHTYVCDVIEAGPEMRKEGAVIPHGEPEVAAKEMRIYALKALEEAVAFALAHIEDETAS